MSWYVIYRQKEVIDGPLPQKRAQALCEDLDMIFEDTGYQAVDETRLPQMGLTPKPRYHIQEDQP